MLILFRKCLFLFVNLWFIPVPSATPEPQPAFHLLQFRHHLPQASRLLLQWNQSDSSSTHCHWPGVYDLCVLDGLISLDLSGNNFTGRVPAQLGSCSQVNEIVLNSNNLSGTIPPQLFKSRRVRIRKLDLGSNQLSGTIPPEVGQCISLEYLRLYDNLLSWQIPAALFSLPNLKLLFLNTNNLTGALPDFPTSCSLSDLRLYKNSFTGSLPRHLGNCHGLRILYASKSNLGGILAESAFDGLWRLERLYLDGNH